MLFRLSEVYKSYSHREILRGASFQINPGEKVGLVGRNGAGKTTLFRLIEGTESPDSGEVITPKNLKLGFLEQHVDFNPGETVHTAALSAFESLQKIEAEMRRLEVQMAEDATSEVLDRYAELQTEFERLDGFTYSAKAEAMLLGLGFTKDFWGAETSSLSGGQKNRLGLVRLLLAQPDVLLFDEPTNHLDMKSVEWLENYLAESDRAYIIISHDRYFLDKTCNRIIELENGKAVSYKGNYSDFLIEREERREIQRREYENQQSLIAKNEEFIRRNIAGQKTKMAKSRRNMLERLERVEAVAADRPSGNFNLKGVERAGNQVLKVEKLSIGYGDNVLSKDITFSLLRGECLGVIGPNGSGKTTFLKTIQGKLPAIKGESSWGTKTSIGYYSQQLEDLDARNDIIGELRRVAPSAENGQLRSFLAMFLFTGDDIFKSVRDLSGGEKGRLSLAKLIYSKVNVLILDEPTNHLDIPSREALESALQNYEGTIVTVSHDRYFLDRVATQILSLEEGGMTETYQGNYSDFHDWKENRQGEGHETDKPESASDNIRISEDKSTSLSNLSKNQRLRMEQRVKEIEGKFHELEEAVSRLSLQMSQPEIAADHEKLQAVTSEFLKAEKIVQDHYAEWEKLHAELDS